MIAKPCSRLGTHLKRSSSIKSHSNNHSYMYPYVYFRFISIWSAFFQEAHFLLIIQRKKVHLERSLYKGTRGTSFRNLNNSFGKMSVMRKFPSGTSWDIHEKHPALVQHLLMPSLTIYSSEHNALKKQFSNPDCWRWKFPYNKRKMKRYLHPFE